MTDNAGLKGAALIAAEQVASTKNVRIRSTDIVERLREMARRPNGLYTAAELHPVATEAADEIEDIRNDKASLLLEIDSLHAEIERLRHPKIIVGSRELWEAMGREVEMDEATLAAITAYDNCTRLSEDVMGYGPMRAALTAALPHLQTAALKEKAGD